MGGEPQQLLNQCFQSPHPLHLRRQAELAVAGGPIERENVCNQGHSVTPTRLIEQCLQFVESGLDRVFCIQACRVGQMLITGQNALSA